MSCPKRTKRQMLCLQVSFSQASDKPSSGWERGYLPQQYRIIITPRHRPMSTASHMPDSFED
ncbi:hypothetical protein KY290_008874 [Solanum tuberosum]|uniref:Uncharacterized protein n=1 Tax=Solanum tuberosum TaxID=4113 RepID=A0ABQ7WBN4_SOLTU|nr:hypothetical protein KY284_025136 [Solanum tuberosum]KAH0713234.1 hypothetical protein KY289_009193 [Solanum tuberosum]KAH0777463.1 hypothetical protein KY290_008874 [Solanum tuberosum]